MKKLLLFTALFGSAVLSAAAANLLRNPGFGEGKAAPAHWNLRAPGTGRRVTEGKTSVLELTGTKAGENQWWLQSNLPVAAGKYYRFTVDVKADQGMELFAYVERNKPRYQAFGSPWIKAGGAWEKISFTAHYTEQGAAPYLVLRSRGKGVVRWRNPVLTEMSEKEAANLVRNADFISGGAIPAGWGLKEPGTGKRVLCDGAYALELRGAKAEENQWWAQFGFTALKPDQTYRFEVEVKAEKSLELLTYMERNKPVYTTLGTQWTKATGAWQKLSFSFTFQGPGAPPYLVLRTRGKGVSLWRNPVLVPEKGSFNNGDFRNGSAGWDLGPNGKVEKQQLFLRNPKGSARAVFPQIRMKKGRNYLISWNVRGSADKALTDSIHATWWRVVPLIDGKIPEGCAVWRDCFESIQYKELVFTAPRDGFFDLLCELRSGEVWFSRIRISETTILRKPVEFLLDFPHAHRQAAYSSMPEKFFSGRLLLNDPQIARCRILFNGRSVECSAASPVFRFPVPAAPGEYPLEAVARNAAGKEIAREKTLFRVYPRSHREVTFRADGVMLINGKPFLPIGVWGTHGSGTLNDKAKTFGDAGFNLWMCSAENLDRAAANGMLLLATVIEQLPPFVRADKAKMEVWKKLYRTEMGKILAHPALAGYFISDEPAWRGFAPGPIEQAYNFIREIDPYRPVLLNEAPRGAIADLRKYLGCYDAYGVDIYPYPAPNNHSDLADKMMTSVGGYTDICREVVRDRKPVWMTLQGFAWGQLQKRKPEFPRHEDNRFMAYDALLHGAKGVLWWGINCTVDTPEFIRCLSRTVKELRTMSGVLVSQEKAPEMKADSAALRMMSRKYQGHDYWIVLNESGKELRGVFSGKLPARLHVLFENRALTPAGGTVTDVFKPYSVHVYSDSAALPAPLPMPVTLPVRKTELRNYGDAYKKASWIWYPGRNKVPGHVAYFRKGVEIPGAIRSAQLFVTADDFYTFKLNGVLAGDQTGLIRGSWQTIDRYDLTGKLKPGKNLLEFKAADAKNVPCGLLVMLEVHLQDGRTLLFPSDASFSSSEDGRNWRPAEIITKFGGSPWDSDLIRVQNNDNATLGILPL